MDLLLTNDDGIDARGLAALEAALCEVGTTWTVAPQSEQSAKSHGFSLDNPVRVEPAGPRRWAVGGTPADCAYVALHGVLPVKPVFAVSGINHGSNLGNDIFYSGTVAAALEAVFQGVPAMAVSLHKGPSPLTHFETAGHVAAQVVRSLTSHSLPPRTCVNVNVPDVPLSELKGIVVCAMGWRHYEAAVDERRDPRGKAYYWLGGAHREFEPIPDTDGPLVEQGFASVTPLQVDLTNHGLLSELRSVLGAR